MFSKADGSNHPAFTQSYTSVAPELVAERQEVIDLVHTMVSSQRRIVASLRPVLLNSFGLGIALTHHAEDWSRNTGIAMQASIASDLPTLPADAALALFRMRQESLTNVAKYANATRVRVIAKSAAQHVTVCVEDDGVGISPTAFEGAALHGLLGIRERLLHFGEAASDRTGGGRPGLTRKRDHAGRVASRSLKRRSRESAARAGYRRRIAGIRITGRPCGT